VIEIKKMRISKNFDSILSPLEEDVLQILWPNKKLKVREVYEILKSQKKKVALSSIAVILDRLHEKNIVGRKIETCRGGLRYVYCPQKDKKQFETSIIENAVNNLIERFGNTAINFFNERFKVKNENQKKE
jgi:predicted transcriptional regulator